MLDLLMPPRGCFDAGPAGGSGNSYRRRARSRRRHGFRARVRARAGENTRAHRMQPSLFSRDTRLRVRCAPMLLWRESVGRASELHGTDIDPDAIASCVHNIPCAHATVNSEDPRSLIRMVHSILSTTTACSRTSTSGGKICGSRN